MKMMYLVTYYRHNKTTGGNAYKTELATEDLTEAKEKYYELQSQYYHKETFDFASVVITDMYGNKIMGDYYDGTSVEPQPQNVIAE